MPDEVFKGNQGDYTLASPSPFAIGRASVLYKGLDPKSQQICIKVFRSAPRTSFGINSIPEFINELTAQSRLKHPNVLPIVDFGNIRNEDQGPFLVLPLCEGGSLRSLMRGRDFLPSHEALPILRQIALAIDFAHQSGFVHGDIKPENVLFSLDRSHAYLSDFGLSKYFAFEERISTAVGGEAGSTIYLSPEQISEGKQSPRSDIYSFALVATELLTGKLPLDLSKPPFGQMEAKINGKLIEPCELNPLITPAANAAILQALSVDRKGRPSTAAEFCEMLSSAKPVALSVNEDRKREGFWRSLEPAQKVTLITALVAAAGAVIVALIKLIPELLKRTH